MRLVLPRLWYNPPPLTRRERHGANTTPQPPATPCANGPTARSNAIQPRTAAWEPPKTLPGGFFYANPTGAHHRANQRTAALATASPAASETRCHTAARNPVRTAPHKTARNSPYAQRLPPELSGTGRKSHKPKQRPRPLQPMRLPARMPLQQPLPRRRLVSCRLPHPVRQSLICYEPQPPATPKRPLLGARRRQCRIKH